MEFLELIDTRYSVRKFDSRQVEEEKIQKILEIARLAPSAVNKQPTRMLILRTASEMEKLAKCTAYTFQTPCAIIVSADADKAWVRPFDKDNSGLIDASIAGTYIMLSISDLGLGTCWVGHFDPAAVKREFNFPDSILPVAIFPLGYPAKDSEPSARHYQRLDLAEMVKYAGY